MKALFVMLTLFPPGWDIMQFSPSMLSINIKQFVALYLQLVQYQVRHEAHTDTAPLLVLAQLVLIQLATWRGVGGRRPPRS